MLTGSTYISLFLLDISSITKIKLKEIHTKVGQRTPVKMMQVKRHDDIIKLCKYVPFSRYLLISGHSVYKQSNHPCPEGAYHPPERRQVKYKNYTS